MSLPILYTFRRCPYAMRARLALAISEVQVEVREIVLRNKPDHMLEISPKGTVPVLLLPDGMVLEESLDIANWAIAQNDPEDWAYISKRSEIDALIKENDTSFKGNLDCYKYPNRYEDADPMGCRDEAIQFLSALDERLEIFNNLLRNERSRVDMCIFPFVRQFANVDKDWFNAQEFPHLKRWLNMHLESNLFDRIMVKRDPWVEGQEPVKGL